MRVLVSAYGCEPDLGSEPGVGWNWTKQIALIASEVTVLTRSTNAALIAGAADRPTNVTYVYIDLPRWWRKLFKRPGRGSQPYYLLWQALAAMKAYRLHREHPFDLAHHLTWATMTMPAGVAILPVPFVLGPVGGGVRTCWPLWRDFGARGLVYEIGRTCLQRLALINPMVWLTWRRATVVLTQNPDTAKVMRRRVRGRVYVCSNVGISRSEVLVSRDAPKVNSVDPIEVVFVGRLVHWKGTVTALRAVALGPKGSVHLSIIGAGVDKRRCLRLARRLQVEGSVDFCGSMSRSDVLKQLDRADVLLFPSQHDEGGFVVIEAMARGVRPVVLDLGGPPTLVGNVGVIVPHNPAGDVAARLAQAILQASRADPGPVIERASEFDWNTKRRYIELAYGMALRAISRRRFGRVDEPI